VEALLMGLRLTEGVDLSRIAALAGGTAPLDTIAVARLEAQGLLALDGERLRVTEAGALLLDGILAEIVTPVEEHQPA
jgi:coproporphyrinogen III oxidase-like Fe-S oxidoreductase